MSESPETDLVRELRALADAPEDSSTFAVECEGHEIRIEYGGGSTSAVVAVKPQEAVGENATGEVVAERLLDVARKAACVALARVVEERLEVVADELIEDGDGWAARKVAGGGAGGARPMGARGCGSVAREHGGARVAISVPTASSRLSMTWRIARVAAARGLRHPVIRG